MRIAIVALAKNEELYIEEWLNYYRKLGATHFFIFDNNDEGNNKLSELIGSNPDVSIIDVRSYDKMSSYGFQTGCYTKIYNEQKDNFDYFGYFDIDEFLYMEGKTIEEFVSQEQFKNVDVIKFNWRYYGDNDLVWYDSRPVQERFPTPCPDDVRYNSNEPLENRFCKCIIKSGKRLIQNDVHYFVLENGICKHCSGLSANTYSKYEPINFNGGYIKHYGTKTLEEYIKRKCLNLSFAFGGKIKACTRLDWFFNVNKHTPEKDELAKFFYDRGL